MSPDKLELLRPNLCCRDITTIDFQALAQQNIRFYCIDLDNTLAPLTGQHPLPHLAQALQDARQSGYIQDICLVSNIICGEKKRQRVQRFAEELHIPHFYAATFWNRKPSPVPYRYALEAMHAQPKETACIGDQLFTDILGGNRLGLYSILVKPLGKDHWSTQLTGRRRRERRILNELGLTEFH